MDKDGTTPDSGSLIPAMAGEQIGVSSSVSVGMFYPSVPDGCEQFLEIRARILSIVRTEDGEDTPGKRRYVDEIVDGILGYEKDFPVTPDAVFRAVITIGRSVRDARRKRVVLKKVVGLLLEKLFDPRLRCRLTRRDIVHAFIANNFKRDQILSDDIEQIYVQIITKLETGVFRDLAYDAGLLQYIEKKIEEIETSHIDWQVNGR